MSKLTGPFLRSVVKQAKRCHLQNQPYLGKCLFVYVCSELERVTYLIKFGTLQSVIKNIAKDVLLPLNLMLHVTAIEIFKYYSAVDSCVII